MKPQDRIDTSSWKVTIPDPVKRYALSSGAGFCGGHLVGTLDNWNKTAAVWWPDGEAKFITSTKYKDVSVMSARGNEIAGLWSTGKGSKNGAILWQLDKNGSLKDTDLHDASRYTDSSVADTAGGVQSGNGTPKAKGKRWQDIKTRGLIWRDGGAIELPGPDNVDISVEGTDGEFHVGTLDGGIAVLWRGEKSQPIELGPKDAASQALAVRDGEQVGLVWRKGEQRAALWKGSAATLADLTPRGFKGASLSGCARGFQVGSVSKRGATLASGVANLESRAALWCGSNAYFDLQDLLPEPWNASNAVAIEISDDTLRICGCAEQIVTSGKGKEEFPSLASKTLVLWECKLRG